jgi:hypothetical protein
MELKLEGIVETLLVGAMGSLLVLSFIFFAFGHMWNVPVMRRFFDTLFGERQTGSTREERSGQIATASSEEAVPRAMPEGADESSRATGSHRIGRRIKKEGDSDGHTSFAPILLLALLYGLGVIAEAGSHYFSKEDNKKQRLESFQSVAVGKLESGTASGRLARFVSDYEACRAVQATKATNLGPLSLCQQIETRAIEFFYNAKNAVFQQREYYEELSVLEARINFMRAFEWLSLWFFCELAAVCVIASVAEIANRRFNKPWLRFVTWLLGPKAEVEDSTGQQNSRRRPLREEWKRGALELGEHWVKIAAFHILLLVAASAGLWRLSHLACAYSEDQFAKRIFGYYLALMPGAGETGEGEAKDRLADVTPESPYHMFSLLPVEKQGMETTPEKITSPPALVAGQPWKSLGKEPVPAFFRPEFRDTWQGGVPEGSDSGAKQFRQRRLEPSAVQILGNSSEVLVASDQGGNEPFWLFTLDEHGTGLVNPRPVGVEGGSKLSLGGETIESLAAFETDEASAFTAKGTCDADPDHKTFRVFAGPSTFDPEANSKAYLLSFCLKIDRHPLEIQRVAQEELPSPCHLLSGAKSCAVEGIAFRSGENGRPELLLGVQQAGDSKTLAIVRLRKKENGIGWDTPETRDKIFPADPTHCSVNKSIDEMLKKGGGVSDLAAAPSGGIYVTTSEQSEAGGAQASSDKIAAPAVPEVGGALWLVNLGCSAIDKGDPCSCSKQKATLLETFIHKPDGVTHDNGSVLVVFDDEARRKSVEWAPKTFPLGQNEAVFAVVPSPEFPGE